MKKNLYPLFNSKSNLLLFSLLAGNLLTGYVQANTVKDTETLFQCETTTAIIMAHADDALVFMHDSVLSALEENNSCVNFISLTSAYDEEDPNTPVREEAELHAYHSLLGTKINYIDGVGMAEGETQTYDNVSTKKYSQLTAYEYVISKPSHHVSLTFFRMAASTYPGYTQGSVYSHRADADIINAVSAFLSEKKPDSLYTLNASGTLLGRTVVHDEDGTCDVVNDLTVSINECDHYDHVGSAIIAQKALRQSGLNIPLKEFHTYDMARGRYIYDEPSDRAKEIFMPSKEVYVSHDRPAEATPWNAFLSMPDLYKKNLGQLKSIIGNDSCIGPKDGGFKDGTPIVVLESCLNAPKFELSSIGDLVVNKKCVTFDSDLYLKLSACDRSEEQAWEYNESSHVITHKLTRTVIDLPYSSTTPGTPVAVFDETGGDNQKWEWLYNEQDNTAKGKMASRLGSDICIGPKNNHLESSAPLTILDSCLDAPVFSLNNVAELKVDDLCVSNSTEEMRALSFNVCNGSLEQKWELLETGELLNSASNMAIDIPNSDASPGNVLEVYPKNGEKNQQFDFLKPSVF